MLLIDLDGVLYQGESAVPHGVEALRSARARGVRVGFVTNNASRTPEAVAERLSSLGISAAADDVVTSAQAAAAMLAAALAPAAVVLVIGSSALASEVSAVGLRAVRRCDEAPTQGEDAQPSRVAAVVQGFSPDLTYADLTEAALAIRGGAWWVATNLDPTLPTERGLQPGNGALVAAVALATGTKPEIAGKPGLALHNEAVRRTSALRPLVIGDRLDTDIAGARNAGSPSLLVLTGVTSLDEVACAPKAQRPTYLAADLRGLSVVHPAATGRDGIGRCGGAEANCDPETGIVHVIQGVTGGTVFDQDNARRAAVVAAWSLPARTGGWEVALPSES